MVVELEFEDPKESRTCFLSSLGIRSTNGRAERERGKLTKSGYSVLMELGSCILVERISLPRHELVASIVCRMYAVLNPF